MSLYLSLYNQEKLNKCIDLAYRIKQCPGNNDILQSELAMLLNNFDYVLNETEIKNGIDNIFKDALKTLDTKEKSE